MKGYQSYASTIKLIIFLFLSTYSFAQETNILDEYSLKTNKINDEILNEYLLPKIEQSQFVLLGESHGIVEVGEITNHLYNLSRPSGLNTLCIETDPLAAETLTHFMDSGAALTNAVRFEERFPWSIPFYNNKEDYGLLSNVRKNGGDIWGIDQTLMSGFRIGFYAIYENTKNQKLKALVKTELDAAIKGYEEAIGSKNFGAAYIFKYDDKIHNTLVKAATEKWEKDILEDLQKTKEIYDYQFSGQYYRNNYTRAQLMKSNFMDYMKATGSEDTKVLFKLGYNHTAKGLTFTSVYDIGNMVSELADSKGKRSLHVLAMAISGNENRSNPVEINKINQPVNYSNYLPEALHDFGKASNDKYVVIKAEELRPRASKLDEKTKAFIFKYDVIILINDATPLTNF